MCSEADFASGAYLFDMLAQWFRLFDDFRGFGRDWVGLYGALFAFWRVQKTMPKITGVLSGLFGTPGWGGRESRCLYEA